MRDEERIERNKQALAAAGWDAFVCSLPVNVLLLTGYWPVIGTSIAIFTRDGETSLLVPQDEYDLAAHGWADRLETFSTGSLTELRSYVDTVKRPLIDLIARIGLNGIVAVDASEVTEPATYAAMSLTRLSLLSLLAENKNISIRNGHREFEELRSVLTMQEITSVKLACLLARCAFRYGCEAIRPSMTEVEVASRFRSHFSTAAMGDDTRADAFTYCMSGENSYRAYASFQRSTDRPLKKSDIVLVHCNSYVNGYWTDITRTYSLADIDEERARIYDCIFRATDAALEAIHPGQRASKVDEAARNVLRECGIAEHFKHGLGHGVGYHAIDHMARPRLHPASDDRLETGMVFNIEPAVYFENRGGIRQCNMVLVTEDGAEMLTPFQNSIRELLISGRQLDT